MSCQNQRVRLFQNSNVEQPTTYVNISHREVIHYVKINITQLYLTC